MKDNPICSIKTTPNTYNHFSSKQLDEIVVNELIPVIALVMHLVTDVYLQNLGNLESQFFWT